MSSNDRYDIRNLTPTSAEPGGAVTWRTRLLQGGIVLSLLLAAGAMFGATEHSALVSAGRPSELSLALARQALVWLAWAAVTPLIFLLVRRFPPVGERRALNVSVLALGSVAVVPLHVLLAMTLLRLLPLPQRPLTSEVIARTVGRHFAPEAMIYVAIAGVYATWLVLRALRMRELRAAQLESQLAHARLAALETQLHPHFLFNTLHTISALVTEDARAARRMIARLSELLRVALEGGTGQEITLARELEFLRGYLDIQAVRYADRLHVSFEIPDELLGALVPRLLLQPIVENAVRHGVERSETPVSITIRAEREGERLRLLVCDTGPGLCRVTHDAVLRVEAAGEPDGASVGQARIASPGMPMDTLDAAPRTGSGVGIGNTRERLRRLYGEAQSLELENAPDGERGVRVVIELPWRRGESAADARAEVHA